MPDVVAERRTKEATELLERYYGRTAGDSPRFTGSRFEAIAGIEDDLNRLTPADLIAVSTLSAEIRGPAAIRILEADAREITELLQKIDPNIDIVDADPAVLARDSPAEHLWALLRKINGLGPTRVSKLMAAKRPRLIPIWDSFVKEATGLDRKSCNYWHVFRDVLLVDDRVIWTWLDNLNRTTECVPAGVSTLRVLDVLLWMSVYEKRRSDS